MMKRFSQWIVLLASLVFLAVVCLYIQQAVKTHANQQSPPKTVMVQRPDVSVVTVSPGKYTACVTGFGAASSHYAVDLTAQVAGQVVSLEAEVESGQQVKKGQVLAKIDDIDFRAAVAAARQELSNARLSLLEEERKGLQALTEWKASGMAGEPASDLVLRKPQLEAAKAAVVAAQAALETAQKDLEHTCITAPFDALVVTRLIAPGSFVQPGTSVASLYSTDRFEIPVPLSGELWARLPENETLFSGKYPVTLIRIQTGEKWQGRILRAEQHLDDQSRQRKLILAKDTPFDDDYPLLPGTFVKAEITGRTMDGLWRLPSSALSQKGEIWYLADNGTLASFQATLAFTDTRFIYVVVPEVLAGQPRQVLVHPLSHYLAGLAVNPVEENSHGS